MIKLHESLFYITFVQKTLPIKSVAETEAHIFVKVYASFKIQCQYIFGSLRKLDT
jgi:hypothetical protein